MRERDLGVRNITYRLFVDLGRAPTAVEVARATLSSVTVVHAAWRRLHDAHALVLYAHTPELRMANPFSAVPSAHRVHARGRWWYANCAWDALGVCAALGTDGHVETSCPDCGQSLAIDVRGARVNDPTALFHSLVPAASWWDDIAFT